MLCSHIHVQPLVELVLGEHHLLLLPRVAEAIVLFFLNFPCRTTEDRGIVGQGWKIVADVKSWLSRLHHKLSLSALPGIIAVSSPK